MANRICPMCFGKVPRAEILTQSDEILCPRCGRTLQLSRPSRVLASTVGLLFGHFAYHLSEGHGGALEWVVPGVAAILAFGIASPLFLALSSDLVLRLDAPAEPVAPPHGHH